MNYFVSMPQGAHLGVHIDEIIDSPFHPTLFTESYPFKTKERLVL